MIFTNDAHSASGDFLKEFVLARLSRELVLRHQRPDGARLQFQRAAEGAERAKTLRGIGGQGRSAFRTAHRRGHRCLRVVGYRSHSTEENRAMIPFGSFNHLPPAAHLLITTIKCRISSSISEEYITVCATSSRTSSRKRRRSRAAAHLTALSVIFNWLPSSA